MNEPENAKSPEEIRQILRQIFRQAKMDDLPAMSAHVQEIIWLTNSNRATAAEITEAILKDYSLTIKSCRLPIQPITTGACRSAIYQGR